MKKILAKMLSLTLAIMIFIMPMSTTISFAIEQIREDGSSTNQVDTSADEGSSATSYSGDKLGNVEDLPNDLGADSGDDGDSDTSNDDAGKIDEDNEGDKHESEEITSTEDNQNRRGLLNAGNNAKSGNDSEPQEDSMQLRNSTSVQVKETTKEDIERKKANNTYRSKNDGHEIRTFYSSFVSGARKDENDNLVWNANSSSVGHEFTFRVSYSTSGVGDLPAGSIQITIPKQILRDRLGDLADDFTMSLPTIEEYKEESGTSELVYKETKDYIIVYNPVEITAAVDGYFEISYATNKTTFYYKDYDSTNIGPVKDGGCASDPFYAIMSLDVGSETLNSMSDDINVFIDTTAKITSTQKRYPTLYRSWNSSWMEDIPADSDNYYYLIWEIQSYIASPTQMYNFRIDDFVTDLTEGTTGEDYEIVGYKLSGESYFSQTSMKENQTLSGFRYDQVLTRHKKSTYDGLKYELNNTETATVDPVDQVDDDTNATSQNKFYWDPSFVPPTGSFDLYKYGNNMRFNGDYSRYDLQKLQNGEVDRLSNFKYKTQTIGYSYPWTIKDGGDSSNPDDYGYNNVNYDTWDDALYLEEDENPIGYEDYYLDSFTYEITNKDANFDEFYQEFKMKDSIYENDEEIIFYAKFNDDDNWIQIGRLNLKTNVIEKNDEYVQDMTTGSVVFKDDVHATGWRFTTSNKHYYTVIDVIPHYVITNSSYVMQKILEKDVIRLTNTVHTKITDHNDEVIFSEGRWAVDYAKRSYFNSDITKSVAAVSNNRARREYTITWRVAAWENSTIGTGQSEYILQESGTFYDLIPLGGIIDVNSIQVKNENDFLEANEYTYEIVDNYKKSGRAMLIIRVKEPGLYYMVFYNTIHSWDSMKDYGRDVLNPVAYETGNESITKGFPDNGGNLSLLNKVLFNDLDDSTDDNKFIYAESSHTINILTAAASGLDKKVKAEKSSNYAYNGVVEADGKYSYRLRFQNTYLNKAKNLTFFDSLENFEVVDSVSGEAVGSSWYGTLESVDITQLDYKGIDTKVYISTIPNLNLEEHNDLSDSSVWQLVTEDTNLEQAKAIAIDISKTKSGEDFVLDAGDSVTAVLHMKAPSSITEEQNPYAYNNVYLKNTLIDELDETEDYFIHQDYTKVKYHVVADVPFYKVNKQNEDEGIKGITFRLYGTSRYGTDIDEYATSDKNGLVLFKDIEAGTYIMQEYEGLADWLEDHSEHTVVINTDKTVYIDNVLITDMDTMKITNAPRVHTDVEAYKKDLVSKVRAVSGAKFKLEGTSDYGNEVLMYAVSDEDGKLTFVNLEKGKYELKETEVPDGYVLGDDVYKVIVDDNGNYNILLKTGDNSFESTYVNGIYEIYNEPFHRFTIVKKDSYDGRLIEGVKFNLHGVSDYGNTYNQEITTNISGLATFTDLEAGTYILQETYVPDLVVEGNTITYIKDENKYIVSVKKDGNISIDGLEKNEYGNFEFLNDRNKGQITITKEWVGDEESDRQDPTIKISTEKPKRITKVYFRNNYNGYGPLYGLDPWYEDHVKGEFKRKTDLTEEDVVALGAKRIDIDYNIPNAEYKIYAWIDEDGNCYWWSNAEVAMLTDNSNKLFYRLKYAKSIDLTGINTSEVTSMKDMFDSCSELTSLDVSGLDTNNVTDMKSMFGYCSKLTSLDVSSFNTEKVTDMSYMFTGCSGLTSLDVTNLNTSNVTAMNGMFRSCSKLTSLDVTGFKTDNVINMDEMFSGCSKLTSLDLTKFNTSNVTGMSSMFDSCSSLTSLDLSKFETSNVKGFGHTFFGCSSLTSLDVSKFNTSSASNMYAMFQNCSNLTSLDVSKFETGNVTHMACMFSGCSKLTSLDLSRFNTNKVIDMKAMFSGCKGLTSLNLSSFNTEKVTNMSSMFAYCKELTSLDLSNFNTAKVTDMRYMFGECKGLTSLNVSSFNTSIVTDTAYMFYSCSKLTSIDVSSFDTSSVTDMRYMFGLCYNLHTIYASNAFVTTAVTKDANMFSNSSNLVGGNDTHFNGAYIDKTYARIDTNDTPGYFTEKNPETGNVDLDNVMLADEEVIISRTDYLQTKYMLAGETVTYSTSETNYDDQGNEIHWVKNGNVWTYTFYVEDPNADWFVWEEPVPEGYISNYTIDNPGIVENQQAKVINYKYEEGSSGGSDDENITIEYGSLSISKVLKDSQDNVLTPDDDNTEFTITVNLIAPSGYEDLISGTKIFGDYVFKDGVGIIKVHAGQTITIPGVVVGTTYSVDETSMNGYDSSYESNTGTITSGTESSVTFINTIKTRGSGGSGGQEDPSSGYVDINLEKVVTGHFEDDASYTFEITLNNLDEYKTYLIEKYLSNGNMEVIEHTADSSGFANIRISLKNGEHIILKDIPVGAKYKVFEYAGDYTSSYSIVDSNNKHLINNTSGMNSKPNKALSTANEIADEGEAITITYSNKKEQVQDLKLVKAVTNDEDTDSYMFEIEFSNMNDGDSFNSSVGKVTADQEGKAELTIYLAGGEEAEFYSIPVGTKYRIKELASSAIASYTIVDSNGLGKIENVSNTNIKPKEALSTELETVNEGEDVTVTFVNDTVSVDPEEAKDKVEVSVGVTKIVVNDNEEVLENNEDTFTFELKANDDSYPMPSNAEARVVGNGTASFGTITFTETGTYTYVITEKAEDDKYTYDDTIYTVIFEVTKPEGLLEVSRTVLRNGFIGGTITFTNILKPEPDDEPSEDDKNDDEDNNKEEKEEHNDESNNDSSKSNTSDSKSKGVKTGDIVVIYLVNMAIASIVLVVSIKDKRKRR